MPASKNMGMNTMTDAEAPVHQGRKRDCCAPSRMAVSTSCARGWLIEFSIVTGDRHQNTKARAKPPNVMIWIVGPWLITREGRENARGIEVMIKCCASDPKTIR